MSHTKCKNAVFCYNNKDRSNSKFMYKNFEETDSYHTNFQNADFSFVSFRNAHIKYCDFLGACFTKTEFYGTNLRGSSFISARLIDRKSETLEHVRKIDSGSQVSRKYHVEGVVAALLDNIYVDGFFSHTQGSSPDVVVNPVETRVYEITVEYLYGGEKTLTGTFDKSGLPEDFAYFAQTVSSLMRIYGMDEIFDPAVYGKRLRKQSDCIFCNVQFDDYGKTYCYLTDDDSLKEGDYVVVPAGKNNRETVVQIESIEYHSAEEAPFPLDRIKKVIRKYDDAEDDNFIDEDDSIQQTEETIIRESDPLAGVSAEEWRNLLGDDYTESALAESLAGAWNEVGWLMHEVDDDDCASEIKERFESWWALQVELIEKVAAILQYECGTPYIKLLTPFMESNGYHNRGGWWVRTEITNGN